MSGPWARLVRIEGVLIGRAPYFVPLLIVVAAGFFGYLFGSSGRLFTAALETAVPLAAGIFAASLLASESSLELQLAVPGGFRPAALRRLALLLAWNAAVCLATYCVLSAAGVFSDWQPDGGIVLAQLTWLPSLLFFTIAGCLLGVAARSRSTAVTAVALFWVAGHFLHDVFETWQWLPYFFPFLTTYQPHAADWLATRLVLMAVSLVCLAVLAVWLGAEEWLLSSEDR